MAKPEDFGLDKLVYSLAEFRWLTSTGATKTYEHLQLPRFGPDGQPNENSQLATRRHLDILTGKASFAPAGTGSIGTLF